MQRKVTVPDVTRKPLCEDLLWPERLDATQKRQLAALIEEHGFSPTIGDLTLVDRKWYVTHSGLLRLARKNRCSGIQTEVLSEFSDPALARWVVKATVFKTARSKGFVGYGDADPSNVSSLVRGAEMRIAETRAVNRALRKAYGIGLCSVEEIGASSKGAKPGQNGHGNPHDNCSDRYPTRLRDRLLLLIRQHGLDADQVKAFAESYCGNKPLRDASREEITDFIEQLTELVTKDREHALEVLARYGVRRAEPAPKALSEETAKEAA